MNQRSTGLVVGLVIFVILTVGLLASTIYFQIDASRAARQEASKASDLRGSEQRAQQARASAEKLARLLTGDAGAATATDEDIANLRKALGAEGEANLRQLVDDLRAKSEQAKQENENLKKQLASMQSELSSGREEVRKAIAAADAAKAKVEGTVETYRSTADKYESQVKDALVTFTKVQTDSEQRAREDKDRLERAVSELDASRTDLSSRVAKLQETVDQYRIKPKNAASLVDGRVIDVSDEDGQVFLSIGAKQRLQPGMVFDVYDSAAAVQFDPGSGELIPGKARLQILKVEEDTSTARVIPEDRRSGGRAPRPVVKDDVIANAIYSPDQRYRFLVHGKFDVDNDGRATTAEADFVRSRIQRWGGEVVEGDSISGDLDFIVMGVRPMKPFELPPNADASQFSAYHEQQKAFQDYDSLFREAQTARIPVLNWNRMQVLTNEGR
jgi:polyhydroxyalkanoate synthesis regulator phasin